MTKQIVLITGGSRAVMTRTQAENPMRTMLYLPLVLALALGPISCGGADRTTASKKTEPVPTGGLLMKIQFIAAMFVVVGMALALWAVPPQAEKKSGSFKVNDPADVTTFKSVLADYGKAWTTKDGSPDWKLVEAVYAADDGLTFLDAVTSHSFTNAGEKKAVGEMKKLFAESGVTKFTLTPKELMVYRRGDLVWTVSNQSTEVTTKDGKEVKMVQQQTAIWEKRGDGWVMVHEHVSPKK